MATSTTAAAEPAPVEEAVTLRGIGWEGYRTMLRLRGEGAVPKFVYLDGDLLLVSPSFPHERLKTRPGQLAVEVVMAHNIPCVPTSQTTFRRRKKRGGVEADASFYLGNEARIRGKAKIDLKVDPPPDPTIEVVHTHGAAEAIEVHRRFGVPEVWVCDRDNLTILVLGPDRRYATSPTSLAFPSLTSDEVFDRVRRPQTDSETRWMLDVRRRVAETLLGRREEGP